MADGNNGLHKEELQDWAPWTKLFAAFKIALDPKKLLLAAGGILTMWIGWWLLATVFYGLNSSPPSWDKYKDRYIKSYKSKVEAREAAWSDFKSAWNNWNLLHKLAGAVPETVKERAKAKYHYTAEDFAGTAEQYEDIQQEIKRLDKLTGKRRLPVTIGNKGKDEQWFIIGKNGETIDFELPEKAKLADVKSALEGKTAEDLHGSYDAKTKTVTLGKFKLKIKKVDDQWKKFDSDLAGKLTLAQIERDFRESIKDGKADPKKVANTKAAFRILNLEDEDRYKPAGYLSTWIGYEDRGDNPLLLVWGLDPSQTKSERKYPWAQGQFFGWLLEKQLPVLLEPLIKFLSPIVFLFHPSGGFWVKIYLILVLVWTLATWAFFGGAITRIAAVQAARPTESVGLATAIKFTCNKYLSYLSAQLIPLGFVAVLTVLLFLFGLVEIVIPILGDIVIAGIGLPIVLILGLLMTVLLVGLLGWPMMHATISSEGSDAFDAISRSYSYVFTAPWAYAWNCIVAVLYGAVLIFVVGLLGTLTVYLGKWGMTNAPGIMNREPTYLFQWAPTSYGWRDLLLAQSYQASPEEVVRPNGTVEQAYAIKESYRETMAIWNNAGAFLVSVWVYLVFFMLIGFGYSFFWSAGTIIYLLMRQKVDDTEFDEVHLDEDEFDLPPYTPPTASDETPQKAGTVPLQMTEAPPESPAPPVEDEAPPAENEAPPESTPPSEESERPGESPPADEAESPSAETPRDEESPPPDEPQPASASETAEESESSAEDREPAAEGEEAPAEPSEPSDEKKNES